MCIKLLVVIVWLYIAPAAMITSNVSSQMLLMSQTANLTCRTSKAGCMLTQVIWTGPDGNTINSTSSNLLLYDIVSSIVVNGSTFGGRYSCSVSNEFSSVTNDSYILGWSI